LRKLDLLLPMPTSQLVVASYTGSQTRINAGTEPERKESPADPQEDAAFPIQLIADKRQEPVSSNRGYRFGKSTILQHAPDVQLFTEASQEPAIVRLSL